MFDLHNENFHLRRRFTNKTDSNILTVTSEGSLCESFSLAGYEYNTNMHCKDCALAYMNAYYPEGVPNYVILPKEDTFFVDSELIYPVPVLWKGDADFIISKFNSKGLDVYYSGNPEDCIIVFPQFFDIPSFNFRKYE